METSTYQFQNCLVDIWLRFGGFWGSFREVPAYLG